MASTIHIWLWANYEQQHLLHLETVKLVNQDCIGGAMGHLVHSIVLAKLVFSSCSFHHVKRTYNRAAHELAQFAKCNQVSNVWMGVTPPCLSYLVQFGPG